MRVVGYVRVSDTKEREGERFISPDEQRKTIERFVAGKGHELVDVVEDLDASGGTLERSGLNDVLERLDGGEADAIAVAYLTRLSRNTIEGLELVRRINEAGRDVLIGDLDLDTSTPVGRAILTVLLAFAQLELEQRRDSWAVAQRRALERGVYPGTTPTGYTRDENGRMVPDPIAGPVIVRLFERRARGLSWAKLARWLDEELPREDGQPWRPSTVSDMVTTPLYLGRLERTVGGEFVVVENAHEPLVERALWEAVANRRAAPRGTVSRPEPAALAGLVRCSGCGGPLSRGNGGRKLNARGERVVYDAYVCLTRCTRAAKMSVAALERFVLGETIERLGRSDAVDARRRRRHDPAGFEQELERAERELTVYLSAISAADVGEAAFARGARERRERVDQARQSLAAEAARVRVSGPSHRDLLERLPAMNDADKNTALRTLIGEVVVEKAGRPGRGGDPATRVKIVWLGVDDALKDTPGLGDHVGRERKPVAA